MKKLTLFVAVLLALICAVSLAQSQTSTATSVKTSVVPSLVKYSGTAKDLNSNPIGGIVGMTFALYQNQQGGAPVWLETQSVSPDKSGHYTVSLGATKAQGIPAEVFASGEAQWLGVQIEGQPEQPRVLLVSVPYALKAADAETIGGLPPSAFVLAVPAGSSTATAASATAVAPSVAPPATSNVTTTGGTVNALPLWTTATNVQSSALTQTGTGATAKIGVGTTTPGATLDVKGAANVQGTLNLPATGTATSTAGRSSQAQNLVASSFSSSSAAVSQTFQWKAEAANNNTTAPSATLNLLFGSGTTAPAETGLRLSSTGLFTFAAGQTFPGTGTITGVTTATGSGLTGGGTSGALTLSLLKTCSTNQTLQWNGTAWACATTGGGGTITGVTAGTDLTGGGTSGNVTLNLNTAALQTSNDARYAQLNANNVFIKTMTFAAGQTFPGTGSGSVTSVALSAPNSDFTVTGSPITAAGTLGLGWTVAPTSANAANAIVKRDGAGNISASNIVASSLNAGPVTASTTNPSGVAVNATVGLGAGNGIAVQAVAGALNGTGVSGTGGLVGVYGSTIGSGGSANGVQGSSTNATAVRGDDAGSGSGVVGTSATGYGVYGAGNYGVAGSSSSGPGGYFTNIGPNTTLLVQGQPSFSSTLLEEEDSILGGVAFAEMTLDNGGNLSISGNISKAGGSFKIDHPLDPANKYLYHSFVESPDMMNIYNGVVVLDEAGEATVTMPDWFEALNRDFRYSLTAIGAPGPNLYVAEEVNSNHFKIAGGKPGAKVSWQITGVRHDAWADAHRIPLEVEKTGNEKGKYMHPELFGLERDKFGITGPAVTLPNGISKK